MTYIQHAQNYWGQYLAAVNIGDKERSNLLMDKHFTFVDLAMLESFIQAQVVLPYPLHRI